MDVFISHASEDATAAGRVARVLEGGGFSAWFDRTNIRAGQLLRAELQGALRDCRVVALIWSKSAAQKRWVAAELLTAFHLNKFVVACAIDDGKLPYFLQRTIYLRVSAPAKRWTADLLRAIRDAPAASNGLPANIGVQPAAVDVAVRRLADGQALVTGALEHNDLKAARRFQRALDPKQQAAEKKWRFEAMILNLAGYHAKNAYAVKHSDAIKGGQPPKDRLLDRAERYFYRSLFVNPNDFSAVNGLGSILLYEQDLDAAEFFVRRALSLAAAAGVTYTAAQHDLEQILWLKARNARTTGG
jgi:hypothetical protein